MCAGKCRSRPLRASHKSKRRAAMQPVHSLVVRGADRGDTAAQWLRLSTSDAQHPEALLVKLQICAMAGRYVNIRIIYDQSIYFPKT